MPDPFTVYGCPSTDEYLQAKEQNSSYAPLAEVGLAKLVFNVDDRRLEVFWGDGSQSSFSPITDFLSLPDTPSSYAGAGGLFLKVKATEDGIEFASGGGAGTDEFVKVTASDTTAGYLNSKLVAGSNITLTVLNAGGNEQLEISSTGGSGASTFLDLSDTPTSYTGSGGLTVKVKTTEDGLEFLPDKDELVKVSSSDTTSGYLGAKLQAGAKISITTQNAGANESLLIETSAAEINDALTSTSETWSSSKISSELGAKADKVAGATSGNFASLDASGNLQDSGFSSSSFAPSSHTHALGDLSDTNISSPTSGDHLVFNGTNWVNQASSAVDTFKAKVSASDTTEDFLGAKIVAGTGISITTLNAGANEQLEISATGSGASTFLGLTDTPASYTGFGGYQVRVKATEDGLEFVQATDSDELVKTSSADGTAGYLVDKLVAGANISMTESSGTNRTITIASDQIDDSQVLSTKTWSSSKINTELGSKIPLVAPATAGNFVRLLADGSLEDAGVSQSSFASATHTHALGDLSDVDTTGATAGQVLQFNGSLWVPASAGGTDTFKAKVSGTDTTEDFLQAKIVAGTGITISVLNSGANEQLEISSSGGGGTQIIFDQTLSANAGSVLFSGLSLQDGELYGIRLAGILDDGQGGASGYSYGYIGLKVNGTSFSRGFELNWKHLDVTAVSASDGRIATFQVDNGTRTNGISYGKLALVGDRPSLRTDEEIELQNTLGERRIISAFGISGITSITSLEFYNLNTALQFKAGFKFTMWKIL